MAELEADSISLSFSDRVILRDVYLSCQTGEIVGLLGRNGQGKSCLLQIIYGVLAADYKLVRIDKIPVPVACRHPDLIRCLPQFGFLPPDLSFKQVFEAFDVEMDEFEAFYPEINWSKNIRLGLLSGGQKRLAEVFLVLKSNSRFVLLDEPFSHLMPIQVERVMNLMRLEKERKGIIITDHLYQEIMAVGDRFYLLADGKTHLVSSMDQIRDLGYVR